MTRSGDRALIWTTGAYGGEYAEKARDLRLDALREQDTATLAEWREQAIALEEDIQAEIERRNRSEDPGAENYPARGMGEKEVGHGG